MRPIVTFTLCAAGAIAMQSGFSGQAQIIGGKKMDRVVDTDALLNSSAGCQRRTVGQESLAAELNKVAANRSCKNYVALTGPCPGKQVLDYRKSQPFASSLRTLTPNVSASQQNNLIAQARATASAMPAPPGMRLYRVTFKTGFFTGGPLPMWPVDVEADYAVCFGGHS